jgi:hypothetical protein
VSILHFNASAVVSEEGDSDSTTGAVARETIPRSIKDAYLTGMYVESADAELIYYTTQLGVYSYNVKSKGTVLAVFVALVCSVCNALPHIHHFPCPCSFHDHCRRPVEGGDRWL